MKSNFLCKDPTKHSRQKTSCKNKTIVTSKHDLRTILSEVRWLTAISPRNMWERRQTDLRQNASGLMFRILSKKLRNNWHLFLQVVPNGFAPKHKTPAELPELQASDPEKQIRLSFDWQLRQSNNSEVSCSKTRTTNSTHRRHASYTREAACKY